ncbi:hypothetical protein V8G54_015594 [Vigna mungo]|uniref:Uncharacterized protein n=1 Tax=Vigna mungo TaxID=3915 RepID=A0AAQ3RWZ4_VIGMU
MRGTFGIIDILCEGETLEGESVLLLVRRARYEEKSLASKQGRARELGAEYGTPFLKSVGVENEVPLFKNVQQLNNKKGWKVTFKNEVENNSWVEFCYAIDVPPSNNTQHDGLPDFDILYIHKYIGILENGGFDFLVPTACGKAMKVLFESLVAVTWTGCGEKFILEFKINPTPEDQLREYFWTKLQALGKQNNIITNTPFVDRAEYLSMCLESKDIDKSVVLSDNKCGDNNRWGWNNDMKISDFFIVDLGFLVVNSFDDEGICAIIDSTKQWFNDSQIRKAAGNASWWRETRVYSSHLKDLLEQIFAVDSLIGPLECPFLYARIFTSVAKFSSLISGGLVEHYLYLAMKAVTIDVALSNLLPEATNEVIQSQLLGLFSSLIDLLNHASEETLHLVLDTLLAAVKAVVENMISPVILNVWASHVSDPFISIDALEILELLGCFPWHLRLVMTDVVKPYPETIKSIPGCIHPLVARILPYVGPILNKPQEQTEGLVSGSLDLNAPADVVKAIYDVSFNAVVKIILQSDDHSEIQNATECLSAFISGGRQEILAWGSDSGSTMRNLLDIASR